MWKKLVERKGSTLVVLMLAMVVLGTGVGLKPLWGVSQSIGAIRLLEVAPRIFTPNGDALNDVVFLKFDTTLTGLPIESAVYDISGAKVSGFDFNINDTALSWDGKNDSGETLPAGIYIYSIKIGNNVATGTLVLAR